MFINIHILFTKTSLVQIA